jgi:peptidoglycan hydrolase-like protein with peptidoglycan-binding domain
MNTKPWGGMNLPINLFESNIDKQEAADRKKQEQEQEKADAESERDAYNKKFKPELSDPAWSHANESRLEESPDSALAGDTILLTAKSKDIVAGAAVRCFIRDFAASAPWLTERKLSARVGNDDSVQVEWVVDKNENDTENPEFKFWFESRNADSTIEASTAQTPILPGKAQSIEYIEIPDVQYNSGSALPLPGESWELAGILATVAAHAKETAPSSLLVCGHASDSDKGICSALDISKWRSIAIKALLANDEAAWLDVAHDFSCSKDIQQFLVAASTLWGKDCHPGDVNGVIGPESKTAIRNYKKLFNSSLKGNLPDSDAIDDAFLRSMVALYRDVILDQYKQATGETSLPDVAWAHDGKGIYACGTSFKPEGDAASKSGGRVEIFFITDAAKAVITDPPDPKTAPSSKELSIFGTGFTRTLLAPVQGSLSKKMSVAFIEIADIHFHHNCALPCLDSKGELIGLLAQAFEYAKKYPDRECIVEGHADTSGDPEYNLAISKRRAESIKALLGGDISLWNGVVEANGAHHKIETEDYQATLKALAEKYSWPCDPGDVDNENGPKTEAGVKGFQTEYNKRFTKDLKVDGAIGLKTWEAIGLTIRSLLEDHLKNNLKLDPIPTITYGYPDGNGIYPCGESCPIENAGDKNYKSAENRRVELVFYNKGEAEPAIPPAAGREIGLTKDPVSEKEWGKSVVGAKVSGPIDLKIISMEDHFAPGKEKITIKYDISGAGGDDITLDVLGDQYPNNPVYTILLTAEQKADGNHTLEWDGISNCKEGLLKDTYINPLFSPYTVKIYRDDASAATQKCNVLYHSISLSMGSYTADNKEPDKSTEQIKWTQYKLNTLGYFAGPVDGVKNDQTIRSIKRYTHAMPGMNEIDDETNADLQSNLEKGNRKRTWLEGGTLPEKGKKARLFLDHDYYYETFPEFGAPNGAGDKDKVKLDPIEFPLEATILLIGKDDKDGTGKGIDAPEAIGPVEIKWTVIDPLEDLTLIPLPSAKKPERPSPARTYVQNALAAKGQVQNNADARDNCATGNNGFRGTNKDYFVIGDNLPPFQSRNDSDDVFSTVHCDKTDDPNKIGRTGIIVRTSHVAGDNFSLSASLSFDALSNKDALIKLHEDFSKKKVADSLSKELGGMTLWRRHSVAMIVTWPDSKRSVTWAEVQDAYKAAHIEVVAQPQTVSIETLFTAADQTEYETLSKNMHPAWSAGEKTGTKFNKGCMYSTPLPQQGNLDPDDYKALLRQKIEYFYSPNDGYAFITKVAYLIRKAAKRTVSSGAVVLLGDWISSVKVKHHFLFIPYHEDYQPSMTCLGLGKGVAIIDNRMNEEQDRFLMAHELGHCHFLLHHQTKNGVSDNPVQHDTNDKNCIMCYPWGITSRPGLKWSKNDGTEATFCGKCLLKLRGWAIANGDLPAAS